MVVMPEQIRQEQGAAIHAYVAAHPYTTWADVERGTGIPQTLAEDLYGAGYCDLKGEPPLLFVPPRAVDGTVHEGGLIVSADRQHLLRNTAWNLRYLLTRSRTVEQRVVRNASLLGGSLAASVVVGGVKTLAAAAGAMEPVIAAIDSEVDDLLAAA